jgi:DNA phosphorothioation-associated putative methyltransferase
VISFSEYKKYVEQVKIGKVLPDAIYLHASALEHVSTELRAFLESAIKATGDDPVTYNILKFHTRDFKVSLLNYPKFFDESYPELESSCTLDLTRQKRRLQSYADSENPPILHRKETFLHPEHPAVPKFREITEEGEEAGLYEKPNGIGFRKSWERLISRKGYVLEGGRLKPKSLVSVRPSTQSVDREIRVERHLTAIDRDKLSAPMQALARHDYMKGDHSILDYGCGKGHDVRELEAHGIDVKGWDPVYSPATPKTTSDIVNLGFVINVIEDRKERDDALREAYGCANKVLAVSAMVAGEATIAKFQPYKDGVITAKNTFQKYYSQSELRSYIESTLNDSAVAVSPGVFFVFKDKLEEQLFLSERQRVRRSWTQITQRERVAPVQTITKDLVEKNRELFDDFWQTCLDLGRPPANSEFEFSDRVRVVAGSHTRAFAALREHYGSEIFDYARKARLGDLLVYFALGLFEKRKPYRRMPEGLQRDVKAFFGAYTQALQHARDLLFSVGDADNIAQACYSAHEILGCGDLAEGHSLTIHSSCLNLLPPVLRVYVGCATQLYGDIDRVDLVKIHMRSGKVSLMRYDDFENKPVPELIERIKIKLREQDIDFFDYTGEYVPQPLYLKSRVVPHDFPNFAKQLEFDEALVNLELFDFSGFGPSRETFYRTLADNGYSVKAFSIAPLKTPQPV